MEESLFKEATITQLAIWIFLVALDFQAVKVEYVIVFCTYKYFLFQQISTYCVKILQQGKYTKFPNST